MRDIGTRGADDLRRLRSGDVVFLERQHLLQALPLAGVFQ